MLWVWLIYGPRIFGHIGFFFLFRYIQMVRSVCLLCLFGLSGVGVGALGIHDGATDKLDFLTFSFVAVFFFANGRWRWDYKAAERVHGRKEYVLRVFIVCLECFCVRKKRTAGKPWIFCDSLWSHWKRDIIRGSCFVLLIAIWVAKRMKYWGLLPKVYDPM